MSVNTSADPEKKDKAPVLESIEEIRASCKRFVEVSIVGGLKGEKDIKAHIERFLIGSGIVGNQKQEEINVIYTTIEQK